MDASNRRYVSIGARGAAETERLLTPSRPQLPALSYLEVGDVKREDTAYQDRNSGPPTTAASPTYQYPTGPPPPYNSHATPTPGTGWTPIKSGVHTPPESRRTSAEENESMRQTTRQSLPSISEALGVDNHSSYKPPTTHLPPPRSPAPGSPTSAPQRPYGLESSQQYASFRQDSAGPQSYPPQDSAKPAYASSESRPPLQVQTAQATPHQAPASHAHPAPTSAPYESSTSQSSAGSMPPPPSTFGYGYQSYTPRYAQSNPPSSQGAGPIYSPSAQYGPPPTPTTGWRADSSRYGAEERAPQIYGDSVKRHIELYDVEAAFSEVSPPFHVATLNRRVLTPLIRSRSPAAPSPSSLAATAHICTNKHAPAPPSPPSPASSSSTTCSKNPASKWTRSPKSATSSWHSRQSTSSKPPTNANSTKPTQTSLPRCPPLQA